MAERVKPKRRYHSPRRQQQAAATRRAILEAAQRLFEKQVYVAFETKSGVLRALWNLRLRGDRDEIPVAQQDWYREVVEEPDPDRQLRLNARNSRVVKLRIAGLLEVIRSAALIDPEIGALWNRIETDFHANQRVIVERLS